MHKPLVPQQSSQQICSRRRASRTAAGMALSILQSSEAQQTGRKRRLSRCTSLGPSTLQVFADGLTPLVQHAADIHLVDDSTWRVEGGGTSFTSQHA